MFRRLREAARLVLRFRLDGEAAEGRESDSVAAALLALRRDARRETAVSGAARGGYCMIGVCFDCLVTIDGTIARPASFRSAKAWWWRPSTGEGSRGGERRTRHRRHRRGPGRDVGGDCCRCAGHLRVAAGRGRRPGRTDLPRCHDHAAGRPRRAGTRLQEGRRHRRGVRGKRRHLPARRQPSGIWTRSAASASPWTGRRGWCRPDRW